MFSFVPARRVDAEDPRFPRPSIYSAFVNPSSRQSTWGSKRPLPADTVCDAWEAVRDQVLAADLVLGVLLHTPDRDSREVAGGKRARQRC
jgi:hypothetical protein